MPSVTDLAQRIIRCVNLNMQLLLQTIFLNLEFTLLILKLAKTKYGPEGHRRDGDPE